VGRFGDRSVVIDRHRSSTDLHRSKPLSGVYPAHAFHLINERQLSDGGANIQSSLAGATVFEIFHFLNFPLCGEHKKL